jgi:hypothetical protein
MKNTIKTLFIASALIGSANAAVTISGTLASAFKDSAATPANIPTGSLAFLIVDDGSNGFLSTATLGSITAGSKNGQTGLKLAVADAGITTSTTFGGDQIVSIATVGASGSISAILPNVNVSSYVGKNFAVVWFTKSAATITSGGIAGEYFGVIRGADWVLPASDAGTFTLNPTDSSGVSSYYSYSASATAVQVGSTGFFTGTGTAAASGSTAVRTATFQVVPETSTALLGAIGALGLLRRRRN